MNPQHITIWIASVTAAFVVGALLGWLFTRLRMQHRIAQLETYLEVSQDAAGSLEKTFGTLANEALRQSNKQFLQLAEQSLQQFHIKAQGNLSEKEKAIENLVKPVHDALKKTEQQIREIEKERKEAYGALHSHLQNMAHTQQQLQLETRNLVQALKRPEVRGQWGELTLRRLVELAGMVEHCDFYEQEQVKGDEGMLRPDMVVRMPGGRDIVVDVKTPLDAYLRAMEATDDGSRTEALQHHTRNVRERVKELASKRYWNQFEQAPDFIVLFIPGDQFLSAALDIDRELLEYALQQKVILATPTSLIALLRAVAYGWRQEQLAKNADRIRITGEELYRRLATFSEHLSKLGRSLDGAVGAFNKTVGSFDSKVMPGARKLTELGVEEGKPLSEPEQIEKTPREVEDRHNV
jgi:DNA recombination protein RmuC